MTKNFKRDIVSFMEASGLTELKGIDKYRAMKATLSLAKDIDWDKMQVIYPFIVNSQDSKHNIPFNVNKD